MTRRDNVLAALEAAGDRGCTTAELCQPGCGGSRFGARLMELREAGFIIREQRVRAGSHRYVLAGVEAQPDVAPVLTPRRLSAAPELAPIGTHGPGGGLWVHRCGGCLSNHRPGFRCPHEHSMTRIELYAGPTDESCRKVNVQEERHAA